MKISKDQIATLLGVVARTSEEEISCQRCEDELAQIVESELGGMETPEALEAIEKHLKSCPECAEELEFVRRALEYESAQKPNNSD